MNRKVEVAAGLMAELLNYILVFTAGYVIIKDLADGKGSMWELWLLFTVPLFCYAMRNICRHLSIFLMLHLLPILGILFLYQGEVEKKVVMSGIVLLYVVLSVRKRITSEEREMEAVFPPAAAGVFLTLYIVDHIQKNGQNGIFVLQMMIFFMAGYFLYLYFKRFLHYVNMNNRTTENIPVNHVFFSSLGLAGIYTVIVLFLLTVCSNRELLDELGRVLRDGIRAVLSALFSIGPGEVQIQVEQQQEVAGAPFLQLPQPEGPSLFGQILSVLLSVVALLIAVAAAVSGIILAVRLIRDGFYRQRRVRKEQENGQGKEDKIERIVRDRGEREDQGSTVWQRFERAMSPEEKIRRIYRKAIKKGAPALAEEKLAESLHVGTARECCCLLFPEREREAHDFAGLYEKARYSKGMCTGADVQRAKELCEILLRR